MSIPTLTAVIPAAGIGTRMNSALPKQYIRINDVAMLEHALMPFINAEEIQHIVVVLHPQDRRFEHLNIAKHTKIRQTKGGAERPDSVLAGVRYAIDHLHSDWVLVHDAARPGLSTQALKRLISHTLGTVGGILALPSVDTIKQSYHQTIDKTLDRRKIWQAQTPQMFPAAYLANALEQAKRNGLMVTDEASAMELQGFEVLLVEGEKSNFKVTTADDIDLASYYLSQRR